MKNFKRKDFIRLSSAFVVTPFLTSLSKITMQESLKTGAAKLTYGTGNVFYPESLEEVQSLVKKTEKLRALGTRHCFNTIADSHYNLISSNKLNCFISIDPEKKTVIVEGGIKYGELAPILDKEGYALQNLASLPHISVAGSVTTATHGSGVSNGNLATQVRGLELVVADGSVIHLNPGKSGETFQAAVVGLGALGYITKLELAIEPTFQIRQNVFLKMPMTEVKNHFDEIMSAGL